MCQVLFKVLSQVPALEELTIVKGDKAQSKPSVLVVTSAVRKQKPVSGSRGRGWKFIPNQASQGGCEWRQSESLVGSWERAIQIEKTASAKALGPMKTNQRFGIKRMHLAGCSGTNI